MPLDENFPTYHYTYTDPRSASPMTTAVTFKAGGSPTQQLYTLSRDLGSKDTYAVSLLDAHFPSIRYGTLTTMLAPSPPSDHSALVLPRTFTVDLFAPDSSVTVALHSPLLGGNYWDFALPQHSFPPPSLATLDATYAPPVVETLRFRWRKEGGLLSRSQLRCSLVHDGDEPDTVLAMYAGVGDKAGRGELVVYESNFRRVDMEDLKGLEMVMLVSARAINDIWFLPAAVSFNAAAAANAAPGAFGASNASASASNIGNTGNTGNTSSATATTTNGQQKLPNKQQRGRGASAPLPMGGSAGAYAQRPHDQHRNSFFQPDPKKAAADSQKRRLQEEAERRRAEAARLRAIEDEQAAIRRMLAEEEARERMRRQALVDAETERLRRVYEREEAVQRRASVPQGRRQQQQQQQRPPVVGGGGGGSYLLPAMAVGLRVPDSGKRLDSSSRRKSFLGLSFGGSSSGGSSSGGGVGAGAGTTSSPAPAAAKKGRGKLVKKASAMW